VPDSAADKRDDPSSRRVREELDPLGRTSWHGLTSLKGAGREIMPHIGSLTLTSLRRFGSSIR